MAITNNLFPSERKTNLPGGYMGKILRVNLTDGTLKDENLPEEPILRKLIGGQALANYILLNELPVDASAMGVESKVVMMTGPLTGTGLTPGGTKVTAVYLSPATKTTLGRGAASGFWSVALKGAGYDGIIIEGAARQPTYLCIEEGKTELRDASKVWGQDARASEDLLREEVRKTARVMTIGPAGENLVPGAMLINDYNHNAAHGGGAIFGAKKLKGIVVQGTERPRLHDKLKLIAAGERWRNTLQIRVPEQRKGVGYSGFLEALPNNNMQSTLIAGHNRGFEKNQVRLKPCFQCASLCPWDIEIGEGPYAGERGYFNAGSEWMDTFFNLGIKGNAVFHLAEKINNLGIECSHFAFGASVAFEAWQRGALKEDRTDGLRFEWGNVEVVEKLLEMCARREGRWGQLLAEGPYEVAEFIGGDAMKWVVHTKKGTPALHDWRPHIGQMLKELVASGGMKPQGQGTPVPPPDLKYREKWGPLDREKPDGWAWSQIVGEQIRQFCGLFGVCWFAQNFMKPDGLNCMVDALNATTGWELSMDQALLAGYRAMILQSVFASQRGWAPDLDWKDVGQRFLDPVPDGKYAGFTIAKWLPDLVYEYYRLSGRHETSGRPFKQTLSDLDLLELSDWAHPN